VFVVVCVTKAYTMMRWVVYTPLAWHENTPFTPHRQWMELN